MKKIVLVLALVLSLSGLFAHPASDVKAKFNISGKNLAVIYQHAVKDNAQHFISEVVIELNGKTVITQNPAIQDDNNGGDLSFKIPEAKPGDKITIKTKCNKGGSKDYEMTVSKIDPRKESKKEVPVQGQVPADAKTPLPAKSK